MRTILFLSAVLIFGLVSCNNATSDSVEINGVRWATRNVETPGTFARNPESAGGFFTWDEAQNACPRGWRLPTREELVSLQRAAGGKWTARSGVNGRTFGIAPNQIFLPAAGLRRPDGALNGAGIRGNIWSSASCLYHTGRPYEFRNGGVSLRAGSGSSGGIVEAFNPHHGFSVRCVVE